MVSTYDFAALRAEGKVALAMSSGFLGLGDFPESFSGLKRLTGLSDPALAKALKKLLEMKVIERTPDGRYKLRTGQGARLATYLGPFYSDHFSEKAEQVAKELARFDEVLAVVLFGSAAQGRAARDSDIDLLIVLRDRDKTLEERIDRLVSETCAKFDLPFEHVYLSLEGLRVIAEHEYRFIFGLVEGYRCLLDRAGIDSLLAAKKKEIEEKYEYHPEVPMWLLKK